MESVKVFLAEIFLSPSLWQWIGVLVSIIFTVCAANNLFRIKRRWWTLFFLVVLAYLASGTVVYIGDWANLPLTFLILLIIIWVCSEDSGWKKISVGLLFGSTMFAWNAIVDNFIWSHFDYYLLPRIIFCAVFFVGTRLLAPERDYDLEPNMWRLILLLTMVPVGNVLSVVLLSSERWTLGKENLKLHFAVLCFSLLAFVGLLWAIRVLVRQRKLEQEAMYARMNRKYYETMEQQHFEIRRLRHDMANHLQAISVLPEEERKKYIQELLDNNAVAKSLNYCGDSTVNAVLSVKEHFLRQQHIIWEVKLDIPEELPFEKVDICAIIANGIDNAAEACVKLPEKERQITLQGRAGKGILALKIINSCENCQADARMASPHKKGAVLRNSVFPKTTKADRVNHGYGLKSIEESVRRYGGNMEVHREGCRFELFCYLPFHCGEKDET